MSLIWNLSHQLLWLLRILWRTLSSQLASAIHARSIISLRIVSRFVHYLVGPIGFVSTFPISCKSWLPLEGLCLTRHLCSSILAPSVESYEELHAVYFFSLLVRELWGATQFLCWLQRACVSHTQILYLCWPAGEVWGVTGLLCGCYKPWSLPVGSDENCVDCSKQ